VTVDPKRARHCTLHQYGSARSLQFKINDNDVEFVGPYKHLDMSLILNLMTMTISRINAPFSVGRRITFYAILASSVFTFSNNYLIIIVCLFGSVLWRLDHNIIGNLRIAWRRVIS
jgi:hypothetical protein